MSCRMLKYATVVVAVFLSGGAAFGQSDNLALSSALTSPGGTVSLNLSLTSTAGSQPAGVEWTLIYPSANIVSIVATAGAAATSAGKSIFCAGSPGSYTCLLTGLNPNIIQNGVIAVVNVTISASATSTTIGVTNAVSTSTTGVPIPTTATGGTITSAAPLSLTSLSCNPGQLSSLASSTCTVSLSGPAPTGGVVIVLGDNSTILTVPSFVTVPVGNSSATFAASSGAVTANQTATVTATYNGASQSFSISLVVSTVLSSLTCSPGSLASGSSSTCTVALNQAAPQGGATVPLSSNNTALTVPAAVSVLAGSSSANFTAGAGTIPVNQTASVTATLNGATQTATLNLMAPMLVSNLACSPTSLASGSFSTCSVTLNQAVPPGGTTVSLSSNNAVLAVPSSVGAPAGANTATFTATAGNITANQTAAITATLNGASQSASISLVPPVAMSSLACNPTTLASGSPTTCTVTLSQAAPSGGTTVSLSSNNTALSAPSSVNVYAGASTATFTATAGTITANQTAAITATLNGTSQSASISLVSPLVVSSLACSPTALAAATASTCTVTLSQVAPSGGASVSLSSNNTALSVAASVNVAAGASTAPFTATAGTVTANQTAVITATLNGASQSVSISLVTAVLLSSMACNPSALISGSPATCTVTLNQAAPSGGATVALSSNSTDLGAPASIAIAAGSSSAAFTATAGTIAVGSERAILTGTLNGSSQQVNFILASELTISSFGCTPSSLVSGESSSCTITLNRNTVQTAGLTVMLADSNSLLTVPGSVVVPTRSKTATFEVTAGTIPSNQTATITATISGGSESASLNLTAGTPGMTTLYSFAGGSDGANPQAGVVVGANGALYGTTLADNPGKAGMLFELTPPSGIGKAWNEQILVTFPASNTNGGRPAGDLLFYNGALIDTTYNGGASSHGSAVAMRPSTSGAWTVTDLHNFVGGAQPGDGSEPQAGMVLSAPGTLYGTTQQGGLYSRGAFPGAGTVFYLAPPATPDGTWSEGLLHNFSGGSDGADPEAPLVIDARGHLYGTAYSGGSGDGTVFELTPPVAAGDGWTLNVIHTFYNNSDGANPRAGLILDASGALYGTTVNGGLAGMGTVFQLKPPAVTGEEWTETVLYHFTGENGDGANPQSGLVFDSNGRLYGTTPFGGSGACTNPNAPSGCGTLFELTPPATPGGAWSETVLHSFTGENGDGANPQSGLVFDRNGRLYGTTSKGGKAGKGTVYTLTPWR